MSEKWKEVLGFEGRYEVSSEGRVRSVERRAPMPRNGPGATKLVRSKILGNKPAEDGYVRMTLLDEHGKLHMRYVHRIVLEAFVGLCPPGLECCHGDGNRSNNRLDNLRWDTRPANHADKNKHGTASRGERNSSSKLTWAEVDEIRSRLDTGEVGAVLSREFGVSNTVITSIRKGRTWARE